MTARAGKLGLMASRRGSQLLEATGLPRPSSLNILAPSTPGRLQPQPPREEQLLLEQTLPGQPEPPQKPWFTWPSRGLKAAVPLLLLLLVGLGLPQSLRSSKPLAQAVRLSDSWQGGQSRSGSTHNAAAAQGAGSGAARPCLPSEHNSSTGDLAQAAGVATGAARSGLPLPAPLALSASPGRQGQPLNATQPLVVLPASPDACAQALQIPKVALLFMTQGELHHEQTWRLWFKSAAGALPTNATLSNACTPEANTTALLAACSRGDSDEISQQHLFSVYVHAPPSFTIQGMPTNVTEYPAGSLWRGRLIEHRMNATSDNIESLEAARSLLHEAYRDSLNHRFLLLSESDIPLYDPLTLYSQLMNETLSRVEGCRLKDAKLERWSESLLPDVDQCQWRRSSKWFMLQREHASVVLQDRAVFDRFKDWCLEQSSKGNVCWAEEHYIPTLLGGVHNLTHQLMCDRSPATSVAQEYKVGDVTLHTFKRLRSTKDCKATTAQNSAEHQFIYTHAVSNSAIRDQLCTTNTSQQEPAYRPLSDKCFLLSQGWPKNTVHQMYRLFSDCGNGLQLLSADVCHNAGPFKPPPRQGQPLMATLPLPEVATTSNDTCAEALQIPKAALLFLTKGPIFHEPTWRLWFKSAAGVVPAASVLNGVCSEAPKFEALSTACSVPGSSLGDEISQQHLFSVYVHAPPSFNLSGMPNATDYPLGSLWRGRLVQQRVYASWGGMSLVEATRHLMWEAFRDPLNSRFLLLSESDIPLYDPLTLYTQLMAETRSRVEGCRRKTSMRWRWTDEMELPGLKLSHWRKSSQWVMLLRNHTRLVLEDTAVFRKFEEWCFSEFDFTDSRDCFADEHYIPTLLGGVHGLEHQMHCQSSNSATATDWTASMNGHPKEYKPADVTRSLVSKIRSKLEPCDAGLAQKSSKAQFVPISTAVEPDTRNETCSRAPGLPLYEPLSAQCYLLARKFPQATTPAVYNLTTTCDNGLGLLSSDVCNSTEKSFSLPPKPPTASLEALEVLPESLDACSQALQLPRVALLFLTQGELHHEKTWRLWFKSAAGVLPAAAVLNVVCGKKIEQQQLLEACTATGINDEISQQHLFSVYVHAPPSVDLPGTSENATDYPVGSLWKGRLVGHHVDASQGTMGFVEAARSLLWEAYKDPLNTRFLLLSESDIPLYDPFTLYTQLMAETTSRVESCWVDRNTPGHFPVEMRDDDSLDEGSKANGGNWWHTIRLWLGLRPSPLEMAHDRVARVLDESTWRKGSPWFVLQRRHAKLVLEDNLVFRRFEKWCKEGWDQYKQEYKDCRPDEHYFATLLGGVHQLQEELVSCEGVKGDEDMVDYQQTNDSNGLSRAYQPAEVTAELIASARSFLVPCNGTRAQEEAQRLFTTVDQALGTTTRDITCATLSASGTAPASAPLAGKCRLTAGRFSKRSAGVVYQLFIQECGNGLRLLREGLCDALAPSL